MKLKLHISRAEKIRFVKLHYRDFCDHPELFVRLARWQFGYSEKTVTQDIIASFRYAWRKRG